MSEPKTKFATIDEYNASFPKGIQAILKKIRTTIREAAPDAEKKRKMNKKKSAGEYIDCVNVCIVTDDALQKKC